MKAFSFRLESLLQLREASREKALVGYAKSIKARQKIEVELNDLNEVLTKLHKDITLQRTSSLEGFTDQSFQNSMDSTKQQILNFHGKLEDAKKIELSKKKIFLAADGSLQSILRLKDKQSTAHLSSQLKKEERELDDIISSRFVSQNLSAIKK